MLHEMDRLEDDEKEEGEGECEGYGEETTDTWMAGCCFTEENTGVE